MSQHDPRRRAGSAPILLLLILLLTGALVGLDSRSALGFTAAEQDYLRRHVVLIDDMGSPLDPATEQPLDEPRAPLSFADHLDLLLGNIRAQGDGGTRDVLLFVHGGLNTFDGARARALRLGPAMEAAGYQPLFLIWSSSLPVGLKDQLARSRNELNPNPLVNAVYLSVYWPFVVLRGAARGPEVYTLQIEEDLSTISRTFTRAKTDAAKIYRQLQRLHAEHPETAIEVSWPAADCLPWTHKFSRGALYCRTLPLRLATSPFVTDLGADAWQSMRRRAQSVFRRPDEFRFNKGDTLTTLAYDGGGHGGLTRYITAFASALAEARLQGRDYELTLVGHSMGTIIICEVLRRWPELPYARIVFMAAACSIRDAESGLVPTLRDNPGLHFYNLCLHPDAESREINYGDLPHRGTLLTWIDNFYTSKESFLGRTLGRWSNITLATSIFPDQVRGQVHLKAFGLGDNPPPDPEAASLPWAPEYPGPQRHGDFGDYPFWEASFLAAGVNRTMADRLHWRPLVRAGLERCYREGDWGWLGELGLGARIDQGVTLALMGEFDLGESGYPAPPLPRAGERAWHSLGLALNYESRRISSDTYLGWGRFRWEDDGREERRNCLAIVPMTSYNHELPIPLCLQVGLGYRFVWMAGMRGLSEHGQSGWTYRLGLQLGGRGPVWSP